MIRPMAAGRGIAYFLLALAVVGGGRLAYGDTFVIGGFDGTRSNRPFLGPRYDFMRAALQNPNELYNPSDLGNPAYSWSTITGGDYTGVSFKPETNEVTAAYLEGVDLLLMTEVAPIGWDPNNPDKDAVAGHPEYAAIANFVKQGGCLVIVTEFINAEQISGQDRGLRAMANWTLEAMDNSGDFESGAAGRLTFDVFDPADGANDWGVLFDTNFPGSQVLHGPFPYYIRGPYFDGSTYVYPADATTVDSYLGPVGTQVDPNDPMPQSQDGVRLAATPHQIASVLPDGSWAKVIGERDVVPNVAEQPLIMEIPLGVVGGEEDAGAVLVIGDTLLQDLFVPGNDDSLPAQPRWNVNNGTMLLNFLAQQMNVPRIPEPSVVVMLVTGAVVGCGLALRRRRKK